MSLYPQKATTMSKKEEKSPSSDNLQAQKSPPAPRSATSGKSNKTEAKSADSGKPNKAEVKSTDSTVKKSSSSESANKEKPPKPATTPTAKAPKPEETKPSAKSESKPETKSESKSKASSKPEETKPTTPEPEETKPASSSKPGATKPPAPKADEVKLSGLYAFKLAMSSLYDKKGNVMPVTFLEVKPWVVSQIKQNEKEGYNSVQVACMPQKNSRSSKALKAHLSPAGFADGARYVREIRQTSVENIKVGQSVSIHSLQKGDRVKLSAVSKGHGFAGVVKRWGFKGGPASHGSKTHRMGGSIGNRTEPGRVMPGKKMPGHYGVENTSLKKVQVVDVISDKNLIVVKGPVPGSRNGLVFLRKQDSAKA